MWLNWTLNWPDPKGRHRREGNVFVAIETVLSKTFIVEHKYHLEYVWIFLGLSLSLVMVILIFEF